MMAAEGPGHLDFRALLREQLSRSINNESIDSTPFQDDNNTNGEDSLSFRADEETRRQFH